MKPDGFSRKRLKAATIAQEGDLVDRQGTAPLLCGLKVRCITSMLAVREAIDRSALLIMEII
jgi:hypothetical protein